jgi:hypothetical protein
LDQRPLLFGSGPNNYPARFRVSAPVRLRDLYQWFNKRHDEMTAKCDRRSRRPQLD